MKNELTSDSQSSQRVLSQRRLPAWRRAARAGRTTVAFVWKFYLGMIFCQSLVGAVLVVGWAYRLMQRAAFKHWWKQSHLRDEVSFAEFVGADYRTANHRTWPNWIVRQSAWRAIRDNARHGPRQQLSTAVRAVFVSLWLNLKTGFQGIFNTWVLTLPAGVLWLFAWYDGWNNSFNKGYEQAVVGPLTGIFGVMLFIAAMFYVPLAQARQAVTGQWRSFYQFRIVWKIISRRWLVCVGLAMLYSALCLPATILKTLPGFFPQMNPALGSMSDAEALLFLKRYFFWSALWIFPAYVALRIVAARVYASGLLAATRSGAIPEDALAESEWETLHRLDLLHIHPERKRHAVIRLVTWAGTRAGRLTAGTLLVLVWFTFVAQIFVSEFFNYHPKIGWLNQPLIQLPSFNYIPPHLKRVEP